MQTDDGVVEAIEGGYSMTQKWAFREIEGLLEISSFNADDAHGCFAKDYSKEIFEAHGIPYDLQEVFYTIRRKGTVRALHFQRVKQQSKLARCI